jgi:hypothetical protein
MGLNLACIVQRFLYDGDILDHGASPDVAGESSHRRLLTPSPCVPTQPSGSEVGESSEERKYSYDADYHQLLKDYRKVQALLSSPRLNAKMLRGELDVMRDVRQVS